MPTPQIPGLSAQQSQQARDLLDVILLTAATISNGDEGTRRRVLGFLRNRLKVHLDGISAPEKVKLTAELRERQGNECPVCKKQMSLDPDEVEKHRTNRGQGYANPNTIQLRCRACHRDEHKTERWS